MSAHSLKYIHRHPHWFTHYCGNCRIKMNIFERMLALREDAGIGILLGPSSRGDEFHPEQQYQLRPKNLINAYGIATFMYPTAFFDFLKKGQSVDVDVSISALDLIYSKKIFETMQGLAGITPRFELGYRRACELDHRGSFI